MAWNNVKNDFSNEAYFEVIGPLVQKLLSFVRLGLKWKHCALVWKEAILSLKEKHFVGLSTLVY